MNERVSKNVKLGVGVGVCVIMNIHRCVPGVAGMCLVSRHLWCARNCKCELLIPSNRTLSEPTEPGTLCLSPGGKEK